MKDTLTYLFSLFLLLACSACEDNGTDVLEIEIPEGYALSAGTSTNFLNSSLAYDTPADWVTGAYESRFNQGDRLYDDVRTSGNEHGGGLGPVYAGYSCGSCHRNAGRTKPTLWSEGGSGSYGFSSMLVYISRKNGAFFSDYGRVLHDQAIYGVEPEGKLSVTYIKEGFSFPDGEAYELCRRVYTISEWYAEEVKPEDLFCTVRIPLRHVGMGQMMALDPVEIEALAAKSNYPEYGISGRCNYIIERGVRCLGLSGNKAQHADLTVELGFSSDMGATNSRYPEEICEGQTIHPYSDYLLHDMGSEIMGVGLNDNYVSGLARGNEWRTTPLWGIGLQEKVNGHTYFLHDGRARNLIEAIMWHGGEAEASKSLFKRMDKENRDALIAFINSL